MGALGLVRTIIWLESFRLAGQSWRSRADLGLLATILVRHEGSTDMVFVFPYITCSVLES
jgi:hypothetical protein